MNPQPPLPSPSINAHLAELFDTNERHFALLVSFCHNLSAYGDGEIDDIPPAIPLPQFRIDSPPFTRFRTKQKAFTILSVQQHNQIGNVVSSLQNLFTFRNNDNGPWGTDSTGAFPIYMVDGIVRYFIEDFGRNIDAHFEEYTVFEERLCRAVVQSEPQSNSFCENEKIIQSSKRRELFARAFLTYVRAVNHICRYLSECENAQQVRNYLNPFITSQMEIMNRISILHNLSNQMQACIIGDEREQSRFSEHIVNFSAYRFANAYGIANRMNNLGDDILERAQAFLEVVVQLSTAN